MSRRIPGSAARILYFLSSAAAASVLVGCGAVVTLPTGDAASAMDVDAIESLVGLSPTEIEDRLGEPRFDLFVDDEHHYVYQREGGLVGVVGIFFVVPMPWYWKSGTMHCLLVTFDSDDVAGRAQARSFGGASANVIVIPGGPTVGLIAHRPKDCRYGFFDALQIRNARDESARRRAARRDAGVARIFALSRGDALELERLAAQGNERAARDLHALVETRERLHRSAGERMFSDVDLAKALAWHRNEPADLERLAAGGSAAASWEYYLWLKSRGAPAQRYWPWLCRAAEAGHGRARREVGYWHWTRPWAAVAGPQAQLRTIGIEPDDRLAWLWHRLAARSGDSSAQWLAEQIAAEMTPEQRAEAEALLASWAPGRCPGNQSS